MSLNYIHKKKVDGTSNFTHLDISMVNSKYQDIKVQLYYVDSAFMDIPCICLHVIYMNIENAIVKNKCHNLHQHHFC